jgi:hypothetical protein
MQKDDGSWGTYYARTEDTSYAIWAITEVLGADDPIARRGLDWLVHQEYQKGRFDLRNALVGMLCMGEGPKIPLAVMENKLRTLEQKVRNQRPSFIHTSPTYRGSFHVKEIHDKVYEMLHSAKREIRVASTRIDKFYDDITDLKRDNPGLVVKIITRRDQVKGERKKIAISAVRELNRATKGMVVQSELLHARLVVIDNAQALISSADLTQDQLIDEFNAGIYTSDKEVIQKVTEFFDNIYDASKSSANS